MTAKTPASSPVSRITVITHNGRMPSEGGQRIAFQSQDGFISVPGAYIPLEQAVATWQRFGTTHPQIAPLPAAPEPIRIVFASLPRTHSRWCPVCYEDISDVSPQVVNTDVGESTVFTCPSCKVVFRKIRMM
ncbi:MAG: hypothetical protein NT077_04105 [Candidatus Taylorbacteria bacterium]|nr:hypothetical protein [Candidatus Taylorbacteria bacterium]